MTTKIAINGFGRIGRLCVRAALQHDDVEIVAINSTSNPEGTAHLFQYDSTHGTYRGEVSFTEDSLVVDGKKIRLLSDRDPKNLPWGDLGVDIVIDSTGKFKSKEDCQVHLDNGAKKVIITAPGKNVDATIVMGVNEEIYTPDCQVISNASCTTNCLAPVVKVINNNYTIKHGSMTTVHSFTNDQKNLDNRHKDYRRARGCTQSIIPTTTGAAKAVGEVIPAMKGKMSGLALRVPTPNVSLVDVVFELEEKVTVEEVNALLKQASETDMKGILGYSDKPLVSIDYNGDSRSSIVDGLSTMVMDDTMLKILAWYDNEWGYSCRVVDLAAYVGKNM